MEWFTQIYWIWGGGILNTGAILVYSPLLLSLCTHNCEATSVSIFIIKFPDNTAVVGLISPKDKAAYRKEVSHPEDWCHENHL